MGATRADSKVGRRVGGASQVRQGLGRLPRWRIHNGGLAVRGYRERGKGGVTKTQIQLGFLVGRGVGVLHGEGLDARKPPLSLVPVCGNSNVQTRLRTLTTQRWMAQNVRTPRFVFLGLVLCMLLEMP